MRKSPRAHFIALLLIIIAFPCWNCGSKQARYYMLSSTRSPGPVSSGAESITVDVGPVRLPDYLLRPEIVTRPGADQVKVGEFDRWAEPLDETMLRVLIEDLSDLLPGADVSAYTWNRATAIDYRLTIEVMRFEQQPDGAVHLDAAWRLLDGQGKTLRTGEPNFTAGVAGKGYEATVSAMNAALGQLSEEIARVLSE